MHFDLTRPPTPLSPPPLRYLIPEIKAGGAKSKMLRFDLGLARFSPSFFKETIPHPNDHII